VNKSFFLLFALSLMALVLPSCQTDDNSSDDDNDSSADDDVVDDDTAVDDDLSDDDALDDDAVDDDVVDDDSVDDDAVDDDSIDDDSADDDSFTDVRCENPLALISNDPCVAVLGRLYCLEHIPLIVDGVQFGQNDAAAACGQMATDVWVDIHDCVWGGSPLAQCLQEKGWPPDYLDTFDARAWNPTSIGTPTARYQAMNLFTYHVEPSYYDKWDLEGGIVIPGLPLVRISATYVHSEFENYINVYATGANANVTLEEIDFAMHGVWIWFDLIGGFDLKLYSEVLVFTPAE